MPQKRKMTASTAARGTNIGEQLNSPNPWIFLSAGLALCLLAIVAYWPALGAGFIWDDYPALHENELLRIPGGLWQIWTTHGLIPNESHYWPIVYTYYWTAYRLWGFNPFGYHLVNILLHAANVLLLWMLLRRIRIPGGWWVAALFALHPVHVESVAWIHEIKDVLSTFLYLLAFLVFIQYDARRQSGYLVVCMVLFVMGLLTKSVVITLPVTLLIWIWYRNGRFERSTVLPIIPLLVIALAMGLLDIHLNRQIETPDFGLDALERILLAGRSLTFYIGKLFLPIGMTTVYPHWAIDSGNPMQYLFPLGALFLGAFLWVLRRQIGRGPLACYLFYIVTLAPMLGFIDFAFMEIAHVADRFQYLASIGPLLLIGPLVMKGMNQLHQQRRRVLSIGLIMLLLLLGGLTWRQAALYKDLETLFQHAVERHPQSPLAQLNLGAAFARNGRLDDARRHLTEAIRLAPDSPTAHNNLGWVLEKQGDIEGAIRHYRIVIDGGWKWPKTMNDLAWFLATHPDRNLRRSEEAINLAEAASEMTGHRHPAILDTRAAAYANVGRWEEAEIVALKAFELARAAGQVQLSQAIQKRLRLYRSRTPFRDDGA